MARDRLLRKHIRYTFIVTLDTGEAFSGLLDEWDAKHLALINATALADGQLPVKVSGALLLPRNRVAYMQKPESQ